MPKVEISDANRVEAKPLLDVLQQPKVTINDFNQEYSKSRQKPLKKEVFKCDLCGKSFQAYAEFYDHKVELHPYVTQPLTNRNQFYFNHETLPKTSRPPESHAAI